MDELRDFVVASVQLFRSGPWLAIPPDVAFSISCEQLGIERGALHVHGWFQDQYSISIFRSLDDAALVARRLDRPGEERGPWPPHLLFRFDRSLGRDDVQAIMTREELSLRGRYVPNAFSIDDAFCPVDLTRDELVGMTALLKTLSELLETKSLVLPHAWGGREPIEYSREHAGTRVALRAPLWLCPPLRRRDGDPATWRGMILDDDDIDQHGLARHRDAVMRRLQPSLNRGIEIGPAEQLIELFAFHFGCTIMEITPEQMLMMLIKIVPFRLAVEPGEADLIVDNMRLLLRVARDLGSRTAIECLDALDPKIVEWVAKELADERNFSLAKAIGLEGQRAGFDTSTNEGTARWLEEFLRRRERRIN